MTGRGRPRKAKSPEAPQAKSLARPEKPKPVPASRCSRKDIGEKKPSAEEEKPKKRELKQPKCTEEKPSVLPAKIKEEKCIKTKIKTSATGETKPPELTTQEKPKIKEQKTIKATTKPPAKQASVDGILLTTLDNLKIRKMQRAEAAGVINSIMKAIMDHLKVNTDCFKEIKALRTGSYYENLKISNPDEFDVMLTIPIDRVDIQPFGDDGAFYSVALKRGKSPVHRFLQEDGTIGASEMLKDFREQVKKCVKTMKNVELERKKMGCPAVTLLIKEVGSVPISLDVVLGLEVRTSWPPITKMGFQIEGWLGKKVKQEHKRKPYYLVPKYEGKGTLQRDGVLAKDAWRISFSHVEKDILKNHGSEKTCCEVGSTHCCRKACLKLLKHLLHLLKEQNPLFSKFCSYHAKTTLFHACCSRTKDSDWQASRLSHCFPLLLEDFEGHLREGHLSNFFIPTQNLLSSPCGKSRTSLAQRIKEERNNGFPIFLK